MKLSLVVATVDRTDELRALFQSIAAQAFRNFEVIVVDQNDDDRLNAIIAEFSSRFTVRHLRTPTHSCCSSRNLGIDHATGDVIGFPDDDCVLPPDTILRVMQHFTRDGKLAFLAGNCVAPSGELTNGRWTRNSCEITQRNVWTTMQAFAMWVRADALRKVGGFDAGIGPGTQWGSSEEPDLGLRLLRKACRGYYDVTLGVLHPDNFMTPRAVQRAYVYGAGMGRVFRKNAVPLRISLPYFLRPAVGLLLNLLRLRLHRVRYYFGTLRGRLAGYFARPA